jgi:hypothetical protein
MCPPSTIHDGGCTISMWGGAGAFVVAGIVTYVLFRREQIQREAAT